MLESKVFLNLNFQHSNLWLAYLMKPTFSELTSLSSVWSSASSVASKIFQSANWVKNLTSMGILPFVTQSVEIPFPGIQVERQHGMNYPTDEEIPNTFSMTFLETSDWQITSMFREWISYYYDFNSRLFDFSTGNDFKSFCIVTYLGLSKYSFADGKLNASALIEQPPVKVFLLDGIFPIKIESITSDYSGGEPLKINVTFSIDRVLDETNDETLSSINLGLETTEFVSSVISALQ